MSLSRYCRWSTTNTVPVGSFRSQCRKWVSPEGSLLPVLSVYIRMRKMNNAGCFVVTMKELMGLVYLEIVTLYVFKVT